MWWYSTKVLGSKSTKIRLNVPLSYEAFWISFRQAAFFQPNLPQGRRVESLCGTVIRWLELDQKDPAPP